jgi:hypothetical protein
MKLLTIIISIFFCQLSFAEALSGEWKYEELIYRGERIPRPDPNLSLTWTFYSNGTERLIWHRGGKDFCERFSLYSYTSGILHENTFAINPNNAAECQKDPDMQLNRQTQTPLDITDTELLLHVPLGDEEIIYVLKKVTGNQ